MVQVSAPLFDLGLAAMHAGIASRPWLNSLLRDSHVPYMSYYSREASRSRWDYLEVKKVQELDGVAHFHH